MIFIFNIFNSIIILVLAFEAKIAIYIVSFD